MSVGNIQISAWGPANDFPKKADEIINSVGVLNTGLKFTRNFTIGQGIFACKVSDYDEQGNEILERVKDKSLITLANSRLIRRFMSKALRDYLKFGCAFVQILMNADGGFKRTESTNVKGLLKYQEENLKAYFRTNGFNGLDTVRQYLETNITNFGEFSASPASTLLKSAFIPTTDIFNEIVFIKKSRLTFLRMKPHMQLIEDTEISTIWCVCP